MKKGYFCKRRERTIGFAAMKISICNNKYLLYATCFTLIVQTCVFFNVFSFLLPLSYLTLAAFLLTFCLVGIAYWHKPRLSAFDVSVVLFIIMLITYTLINGTDIKYAIYRSCETLTLVFLYKTYEDNVDAMLKAFALVLSACVYANLAMMILFPDWMFYVASDSGGFLLGGNQNQMGCRMLVAVVTNCMCCFISRKWILNTVAISVISLITLLVVGSMTSTFNMVMLLVAVLIPSLRIRKYIIVCLVAVVLFFQFFIVFGGESLKDNEFAVYIIEDVLHKDITFTYRTYMWDAAAQMFSKSPLIGWGYVDSDWFVANMSSFAVGPHNFIYSIMIFGGITLLCVFLWAVYLPIKTLITHFDRRSSIIALGICTLAFMMIMEMYPFFFGFYMLAMAYYYPAFDACLRKKRQTRSDAVTSGSSVSSHRA